MNVELNVSEILDKMSQEIATLIRQVYIKDAEISALRAENSALRLTIQELSRVTELFEERPEVTE